MKTRLRTHREYKDLAFVCTTGKSRVCTELDKTETRAHLEAVIPEAELVECARKRATKVRLGADFIL